MDKIAVSIIIPVYNVELYIERCLESVVNQTLKNIEIIVVNDGSPDNSQKIIEKFAKKYPNLIKAYIKENGGLGSARNYGLSKAHGEYVGYVDSDDFIEIDMFEKMYNKAVKNNYDIVICGNNNVNEYSLEKSQDYFVNNYKTDFENAIFGKNAVWNKIFKRDVLLKNNIMFKEKVWYEDLAFTVKSVVSAEKIGFVNMPLYNYLIRTGSIMNNSNIERNLEILDAFNDVLSFDTDKDIYKYVEFLAIYHIYIAAIVRTLNANVPYKKRKMIVQKLIEYMYDIFPNFKKNEYIKTLSFNKKIIFTLINFKLYYIVILIFKIKKIFQ